LKKILHKGFFSLLGNCSKKSLYKRHVIIPKKREKKNLVSIVHKKRIDKNFIFLGLFKFSARLLRGGEGRNSFSNRKIHMHEILLFNWVLIRNFCCSKSSSLFLGFYVETTCFANTVLCCCVVSFLPSAFFLRSGGKSINFPRASLKIKAWF